MYPQGVCRIRKPAYAGNGCAIFLVFQTEEVGQKDGCGSQTQLRGVALGINPVSTPKKSHQSPQLPHKEMGKFPQEFPHFGPSDWIRTSGLLNPIQARYQTSPHPDFQFSRAVSRLPEYITTPCREMQVVFSKTAKYFIVHIVEATTSQDIAVGRGHQTSSCDGANAPSRHRLDIKDPGGAGTALLRLLPVAGLDAQMKHGSGNGVHMQTQHRLLGRKQRMVERHIQLHGGGDRAAIRQASSQRSHGLIHHRADDPAMERPIGVAHPRLCFSI